MAMIPRKLVARFDGRCVDCKSWFSAGTTVFYDGKCHCADQQACQTRASDVAEQKRIETQHATALNLTSIVIFLTKAHERGLRAPKLRVLDADQKTELVVGLTRSGVEPGSLAIVAGGRFLGCVRKSGDVTSGLRYDLTRQRLLETVAADPVAAAKAYAAVKGRCCFCGLELTDEGSTEVGYGPVCAKHWGLPHQPKGTPTLRTVPVLEPVADMVTL
jgi:hypothetical protein